MSAHADYRELLAWLEPMVQGLRKVFLVHGEPQQAETFAKTLRSTYNLDVAVPEPGQSFELAAVPVQSST